MLDRLTIERLRAWNGDKPVLLALSGGGDSVALLHMLVAVLGTAHVRAAIVDHALREGSAQDAARAAEFARALGVRADILTLSWPDGPSRAQQSAREGRYRVLCEHARGLGLNAIVTAHTADDQAETVLMRAARGSTWRGLAGVAQFSFAPIWPEGRGIALARPLLSARRAHLRTFLRDAGASWIEDPANANPVFERVRVRERLAALEASGFDPSRLVRLAARLRTRSEALDAAAVGLIDAATTIDHAITIWRDHWKGPEEVRRRAMSVLIAAVVGASREPPWTEMQRVESRVMNRPHVGHAHSGAIFLAHLNRVTLGRDGGAVMGRADGARPLPPLALPVNVEAIWDNRLAITAPEPGWRALSSGQAERVLFEKDLVQMRYDEVRETLRLRPLAPERIRHAFAPDINRAKP